MKNPVGVLGRLFNRPRPAPVVSALAMCALNRPLLIAPDMAQALIAGYLSGEITSADTDLATERLPISGRREGVETGIGETAELASDPDPGSQIGVINVSGGLVNRPMPGPSGGGPISYTALRDAFDELLEDEAVGAIVLRIESPGGMASGLFDLADHIHASRGAKPIHALVDDYAYSAAYGLAAACDEIWVSRTGHVGSIGAKAEHYDWSGYNEKLGLTVTPIFAGAQKNDYSPHSPISDSAREAMQAQIDDLHRLFVTSVATYRGLDAEAVRATEAGIFQGQAAIDAGLATRMGTWDDLVASLNAPDAEAPAQAGGTEDREEEPVPEATSDAPAAAAAGDQSAQEAASALPRAEASAEAPADNDTAAEDEASALAAAGTIARALAAAQLPADLRVALQDHVTDPANVQTEITRAKALADLCTAAKLPGLAADLVKSGASVDYARKQLLAATAAVGPELVTAQPTTNVAAVRANREQAAGLDPQVVYQRRAKSARR